MTQVLLYNHALSVAQATMAFETSMLTPGQSATASKPSICLCLAIFSGVSTNGRAIEPLTVQELVAHCESLATDPDGADGQHCVRYIQGFIDGAVETDARIMQDLQSTGEKSTLTERAMRTRMPRRGAYDSPDGLAGFCLGDPLPLREVVDTIVTDLMSADVGEDADSPARVAVEDSLRNHYPCSG